MKFCAGWVAFFAIFSVTSASAQVANPLDDAERQAQSERQQREVVPLPRAGDFIRAPKCQRLSIGDGARGLNVSLDDIILDGVAINEKAEILALKAPYIKKRLEVYQLISDLAFDICQKYVELGYLKGDISIQAQDPSRNVLRINVIEPKIARLRVLENNAVRNDPPYFFPAEIGDYLRLTDLQQGKEQLEKRASLRGEAVVETVEIADRPGFYVVSYVLASDVPLRASAIGENSGNESTGERQAKFSLNADDLLGLHENWNLSIDKSLEAESRSGSSLNVAGSFAIPFGYLTASFSGETFEYRTPIQGAAQEFIATGTQDVITGAISAVIYRDQESVTSAAGSLSYKDTDNFIEGLRLQTSSRVLTIAKAEINHRRQFAGGNLFGSLAVSQGIGLFGSLDDGRTSKTVPRSNFFQVEANASFARHIAIFDEAFTLTTRGKAQWSPHAVFSSEQLFAGGRSSVRGFRNDSLGGEVGGFLQTDLSYRMPHTLPTDIRNVLGDLEIFGGFDLGGIVENYANSREEGFLGGAAVGIRNKHPQYTRGNAIFEAVWERALFAPKELSADEHAFLLRIGASF